MDANTLVLSALRTGAIANTRYGRITPDKSKEAYQGLKSLLLNKFTGQGQSEAAQLIQDWDTSYPRLEVQTQMQQELESVNIASDGEVLDLARRLLIQLEPQYSLHNGVEITTGQRLGSQPAGEYQSILVPPWISDSAS
jgi:hypothetical protein